MSIVLQFMHSVPDNDTPVPAGHNEHSVGDVWIYPSSHKVHVLSSEHLTQPTSILAQFTQRKPSSLTV